MKTTRNLAVIVASGLGARMDAELPKQFMEISGKPILAFTMDCFERCNIIDEIVLVVPDDYLAYTSRAIVDRYEYKKVKRIMCGGETRQESVLAGLTACPRATDAVAIHDGVRPFVRNTLVKRLFQMVERTGAGIPAVGVKETVKLINEDKVVSTLPREKVYISQTPQVFDYSRIFDIHKMAAEAEYEATDDAMLAEQYGMEVMVIHGYYDNIKITTPEDLVLAQEIMKKW
ncbi:MAG: 2-C-methyl-D-erythritol 4-phosphate cytidylyltransferase [Candidatus Zixiibacteriota bacterium]|nr:MAG: 2-C-methyl-D-erythritol 4-phosphate cytidylyltransferase [candidate division Zixibacteria bacterium]